MSVFFAQCRHPDSVACGGPVPGLGSARWQESKVTFIRTLEGLDSRNTHHSLSVQEVLTGRVLARE